MMSDAKVFATEHNTPIATKCSEMHAYSFFMLSSVMHSLSVCGTKYYTTMINAVKYSLPYVGPESILDSPYA